MMKSKAELLTAQNLEIKYIANIHNIQVIHNSVYNSVMCTPDIVICTRMSHIDQMGSIGSLFL